jgi:hypothetical protein
MPRRRIGTVPMNPAERQARRRAKLRRQSLIPPVAPTRRIAARPTRWATAVATLVDLQEEYRAWLENLPPNLESSRLADKLQTIIELDLEELQAIDPPRGYGRD